MIIYTVQSGDSLYAIANRYGTTVDKLAYDNQVRDPAVLVVGQALIIQTETGRHTVQKRESLYSIARKYGITVDALLAANPGIAITDLVYPKQVLNLPNGAADKREIDVNGFTVNLSTNALEETLNSLTYISPFSYQVSAQGALAPLNDETVLTKAKDKRVAPLMCITNIKPGGGFSSDIAHAVLTNQQAQDAMVENVFNTLQEKEYYGLIVDFEYVYPYDRESYNQFLRRIAQQLHTQGYLLATAIAPKISADQPGTLYEAHDYPVHGEVCDLVIIMTYEWGYTYGPAMAVAPIGPVRRVLDYATSVIPSKKILMGMPNYGYNWTLPFVPGSAARVITNIGAVSLAAQVGANIQYDTTQQAPFFNYYDANSRQHEVWFDDARSVQARLQLVSDYTLAGISYWTIDSLFRQGLIVLQNMYDVRREP